MPSPKFSSREWVVQPHNLSTSGIHSDDAARKLGFQGAFVPGVSLYEHVAAQLLNQGVNWLQEGRAEFRFRRPVYDGEDVRFSINADDRSCTIVGVADDVTRATGHLDLSDDAPTIPDGRAATPTHEPLGKPSHVGMLMRIERTLDVARADDAAALTGFPRNAGGRKQVPVGSWINPVGLVTEYFDCPITVHFASRMWHHSPLYDGESLITRGVITELYERSGNSVVRFQVLLQAGDGRPLATVEHESVYQLARAKASA